MIVRFWGVRGGIPTPDPDKIRFGGNTSCLSVELDDGTLLILDAGTGIRRLGNDLIQRESTTEEAWILLSHLHWDHIQGIPFFKPLFQRGKRFHFVGHDPINTTLREAIEGQQNFQYFPVDMGHMLAEKDFHSVENESLRCGGASITTHRLRHPGGCTGYRIQAGDAVLVYATDVEHGEEGACEDLIELAQDADVLITDANYTPDEYAEDRVGWGHSTWEQAILSARAANVRHLILFHHDQDRDDLSVAALEASARERFPSCTAAREGMVLQLSEDRSKQLDEECQISFPDGETLVLQLGVGAQRKLPVGTMNALHPEMLRANGDQLGKLLRQLDCSLRLTMNRLEGYEGQGARVVVRNIASQE